MKIAFYLCGHLRTFDDIVKKNIIFFMKGYDYHLYVSTYNQLNYDGTPQDHIKLSKEKIIEMFDGLPIKNIIVMDAKDTYKVNCINCENQAEYGHKNYVSYKTNKIVSDRMPYPMYCKNCRFPEMVERKFDNKYCYQWKHVHNCYNMAKESGIDYDFSIKSRPDILLLEKIYFNLLPNLNYNLCCGYRATLGWPDDMFAIGTGEAWQSYCNISNTLIYSLRNHENTGFVFKKYPIVRIINIGFYCFENKYDPELTCVPCEVKKIGDKFLINYHEVKK